MDNAICVGAVSCEVGSEQNGVHKVTGCHSEQVGDDCNNLGNAQGEQNGKHNDTQSHNCTNTKDRGEEGCNNEIQQNGNQHRAVAAELNSLANQSLGDTGFKHNSTKPSTSNDVNRLQALIADSSLEHAVQLI